MEVSQTPSSPREGYVKVTPFSPYLFILCMEYLGFLINESCRMKDWIPLKASRQSLGFPLNHKGVGRNRYNFVVERVISKLSGWKSKFLSFVERTVLIKSVMAAIPNYVM